eukprot:2607353-Amphidinium_carterae.1
MDVQARTQNCVIQQLLSQMPMQLVAHVAAMDSMTNDDRTPTISAHVLQQPRLHLSVQLLVPLTQTQH